ncbi:MAG: DMT family transporter, partial [Bacteroidota bacterium]
SLHLIVLIWGFTGILGKVISIDAGSTVFYRMGIAVLGLWAYFLVRGKSWKVPARTAGLFLLNGLVVAGHWAFFFQALKVSNVSVTLACLSSASLFMAILEPLFFRRRVIGYEIVLGLVVIGGLSLIFRFEGQYTAGIVYSLLAAFLAALFTVINGIWVKTYSAGTITMWEMIGGTVGILVFLAITQPDAQIIALPSLLDIAYLLILGLICTAMAFVVSVDVMKELSPYSVSMTINMEPIYAILLALAFFGDAEFMTPWFYAGALLILLTVFGNAYLKRHAQRQCKKEDQSA